MAVATDTCDSCRSDAHQTACLLTRDVNLNVLLRIVWLAIVLMTVVAVAVMEYVRHTRLSMHGACIYHMQ